MFCPKCGAANPDNSNVCGNCGQSLNTGAPQYVQPQYAQPQYVRPAAPSSFDGKSLCIAGLVLGIISLVLSFFGLIGGIIGLIVGIIGIICASMGRKKALAQGIKSGIGTAGLVCSIIGLVLCAIIFIICTIILGVASSAHSSLRYYY